MFCFLSELLLESFLISQQMIAFLTTMYGRTGMTRPANTTQKLQAHVRGTISLQQNIPDILKKILVVYVKVMWICFKIYE